MRVVDGFLDSNESSSGSSELVVDIAKGDFIPRENFLLKE